LRLTSTGFPWANEIKALNAHPPIINSIVTSNPVPEEIEPFKIPIRKIKIKNLIL